MSQFPPLEDVDTTASAEGDFLAREKELLGDDAKEFEQGAGDDDADVAGFENAYPPIQEPPSESTLGESGVIEQPAPPYMPGQPQGTPTTEQNKSLSLDESEHIKKWKEQRELEIERRDQQSEAKRKETKEQAEKSIDDFYENYNSKKEKSIGETREEEKKFIEERDNSIGAANTWEAISKLIDTSDNAAKTKLSDKSRFKELLLSLKSDANAPGAAGY